MEKYYRAILYSLAYDHDDNNHIDIHKNCIDLNAFVFIPPNYLTLFYYLFSVSIKYEQFYFNTSVSDNISVITITYMYYRISG